MASRTRRSVGTRTFLDVLLHTVRIRRLSTERDLADLKAGTTLEVACSSSTLGTVRMLKIGKGGEIAHTAGGRLYLADGVPPRWRNVRTGETVTVEGPFTVTPSEHKAVLRQFVRLDLTAGGEQHVIIIPKADLALVTQVLEGVAA
ncbi:hypothetical protein [Kitasatospora sp. NPDC001175]|uniref:hypothetical protein n=1 Tax=Kitasatospora sp. NPDC001175 TaxID=3157103 RepID=UPI003D05BC3A